MRTFTLVLPFYRNRGMLCEQLRVLGALPADLQAQLHLVVVDDGSPVDQNAQAVWAPPEGLASARLFRILTDVRWNWLACRNLAVDQATTPWVALTDIDHVIPAATWRRLIEGKLDHLRVYRLSRIDMPDLRPKMKHGKPHPHPNTWIMTRARFDEIGGYDERFSGFYGTDSEFRERVIAVTSGRPPFPTKPPVHVPAPGKIDVLPEAAIRYPREVIADASTVDYGRKEEQDAINVKRIRDERKKLKYWRPLRLTFPWEQLA